MGAGILSKVPSESTACPQVRATGVAQKLHGQIVCPLEGDPSLVHGTVPPPQPRLWLLTHPEKAKTTHSLGPVPPGE